MVLARSLASHFSRLMLSELSSPFHFNSFFLLLLFLRGGEIVKVSLQLLVLPFVNTRCQIYRSARLVTSIHLLNDRTPTVLLGS